jgi:hypothetical protein
VPQLLIFGTRAGAFADAQAALALVQGMLTEEGLGTKFGKRDAEAVQPLLILS